MVAREMTGGSLRTVQYTVTVLPCPPLSVCHDVSRARVDLPRRH